MTPAEFFVLVYRMRGLQRTAGGSKVCRDVEAEVDAELGRVDKNGTPIIELAKEEAGWSEQLKELKHKLGLVRI